MLRAAAGMRMQRLSQGASNWGGACGYKTCGRWTSGPTNVRGIGLTVTSHTVDHGHRGGPERRDQGAAPAGDFFLLGHAGVGLLHCRLGTGVAGESAHLWLRAEELLDGHETLQMLFYFVAVITAALNAKWFGPAITDVALQMREVEKEHGLGNQIGTASHKEMYAKLRQQDPKYRAFRSTFNRYHGLSMFSNFTGFFCTSINLIYIALKLPTF
ncbi:hypothetical protein Q5P01_017810 [Channa striata]|uniref:Transmembrane protein 205 n=1 Tax=Channa striata TaxID=64152 RepID=A0AA88MEG1_CHASR|nr:hypothetical protein Q5P01_017810 [Channa striata]